MLQVLPILCVVGHAAEPLGERALGVAAVGGCGVLAGPCCWWVGRSWSALGAWGVTRKVFAGRSCFWTPSAPSLLGWLTDGSHRDDSVLTTRCCCQVCAAVAICCRRVRRRLAIWRPCQLRLM